MDLDLNIKFINHTNTTSFITVQITKNKLLSQSEFFTLMYENAENAENDENENNDNKLEINLVNTGICYDGKIITKFFNILNGKHLDINYTKQTIIKEKINEPKLPDYILLPKSEIKLNFGFGYDVTFADLPELLLLCEYFLAENLQNTIKKFIKKFDKFIMESQNADFDETYYLGINTSDFGTNNKLLREDIEKYRTQFIVQ